MATYLVVPGAAAHTCSVNMCPPGVGAEPAPMADYTVPTAVDVLTYPLSLDTVTPTDFLDAPPASSRAGSHLVAVYYQHFHLAHPFLPPHHILVQPSLPDYLLDLMEYISLHYLPLHMVPDRISALQAAVRDAVLSVEKSQAYLLFIDYACARTAKGRKRAHRSGNPLQSRDRAPLSGIL